MKSYKFKNADPKHSFKVKVDIIIQTLTLQIKTKNQRKTYLFIELYKRLLML